MSQEGKGAISATSLPDLYALIVATGGQQMAIARPGDAIDPISMPFIGEHWCAAASGVPDLYSPILTCGGKKVTIWRPGDRRDLFCMSLVDDSARASGGFENLNKGIVTG